MRICDIPISDVRAGKNWRLVPPDTETWFEAPMEEWGEIIEAIEFASGDQVIYSALIAYSSGEVKGLLLHKEVGDGAYGGDYCEFVQGRWQKIGRTPDPNAPIGQEYIANPLANDPSFEASDRDYREWHRRGFSEHSRKV
jgi:hypothetical protein